MAKNAPCGKSVPGNNCFLILRICFAVKGNTEQVDTVRRGEKECVAMRDTVLQNASVGKLVITSS